MNLNNPPGKFIMTVMVILGLASCKKPVYYNISTSVQPVGSGSIVVSPSSESVLEGASVTFKATPNGDYVFTGWTGSLSGTENPATLVANKDLNIVANFRLREYPLTLSVEGEGNIQERVISTKTEFPSGTVVELTAKAADHWLFDHWEGDVTGKENPAQITISAAKTVKAVFVKKKYDLTIAVEGEGAVQEKVVETKGSYQEGTTVELTATPATGWSFDHWEGDLSGTENPVQITVSAAKSVKAVFSKNKYAYNLKIIGPGVVDEYLVESTKASFEYGTKLLLKAYPNEGAEFVGWSGDCSGNELELELPMDSDKRIVATFNKYIPPAKQYPLQDLSLPSAYLRRLYYNVDFTYYSGEVYSKLVVDYNRDGYVDVFSAPTDYTEFSRIPLGFWTGNPDGTFTRDSKNDGRIEGIIHPRKIIYGDFNKDGYPDFCPISHGWDHEPWPGDYPVIVLSSPSGEYSNDRYTDVVGYFHGGASGDFDNDGDLDIFMIREYLPCVLWNDGNGKFTPDYEAVEFPKTENVMGMYTADSYDIDHDGFLDLVCAGNDWNENNEYVTSPIILFGDGVSYKNGRYTMLPKCPVGYGLCLDTKLKDVDGDGIEELFLFRTGDSTPFGGTTNYDGWAIQVIKWDGNKYIDVTDLYFRPNENHCTTGPWHPWWDFEEIDGLLCLISEEASCPSPFLMFRFIDGVFTPVERPDPRIVFPNGYAFFTDELHFQGGLSQGMEVSEAGPYSGSHCIRWVAEEPFHQGVNMTLGTPADLSLLRENEYVLEFWVKTTNPRLNICTQFETSYVDGKNKGYGFVHDCSAVADGNWHKLSAPLSAFYDVGERQGCDWKDMEFFIIWVVSEDTVGEEFYLDEIRVRKVLPED